MAGRSAGQGFFWLSSRPDFVGEVSQAGAFVRHKGIGRWWASIPKNQWPDPRALEAAKKQYWTEDYGDRRQEIVFIGLEREMSEEAIRSRLDDCLDKNALAAPDSSQKRKDPFPKWFEDLG